jgi:hypothetical protein
MLLTVSSVLCIFVATDTCLLSHYQAVAVFCSHDVTTQKIQYEYMHGGGNPPHWKLIIMTTKFDSKGIHSVYAGFYLIGALGALCSVTLHPGRVSRKYVTGTVQFQV